MALYDIDEEPTCEEECKLKWLTPYEFLQRRNFSIQTHKIIDPHKEAQERWPIIYDRIFDIVSQLR